MDIQNIDNWINTNTFDVESFDDYYKLNYIKNIKNLTISVIIPTLEEEKTIGNILNILINKLKKDVPLIDEIIVIDGGSKDNTINICKQFESNINIIYESDILPDINSRKGKGNQLWKGLYCCKSDIVVYIDSDLQNFTEQFVTGILGPLLINDNIKFIKGFYQRKLSNSNGISDEGGRVTEICARPLINLLYPDLSGFIQPLSGEYGGYTNILKNIKFSTGYGVEMKILIEILNMYGINSMGQVNLYSKHHEHQPINALTKMSYTIMKTMLQDKINYNEFNKTLLIKNINITDKSNIKFRSQEHDHCNNNGNIMNNPHFKYIESDDIDLPSVNSLRLIPISNNLQNEL